MAEKKKKRAVDMAFSRTCRISHWKKKW